MDTIMSVNALNTSHSLQSCIARQENMDCALICELSELAGRIKEISMPPKLNCLQRFFHWLFGAARSQAQERAVLNATLSHLAARAHKDYPVHKTPSAREMIAKIFHIRSQLLVPLSAHFPNQLNELDRLLLNVRNRYSLRIPHELPPHPQDTQPMTSTTAPASIIVDPRQWTDAHRQAGYQVERAAGGAYVAEKPGSEPQILIEESGRYKAICNFRCGTINAGNYAERADFAITWVNGIKTKFSKTLERATSISSQLKAPVHYLHNPTKGYYNHASDSRRYLKGDGNTEEVLALVSHWRSLLAEGSRDILHICHSQGAALTKLAAKKLTEDEKKRIHVLSFGGLMEIHPNDGFASQKNYISAGDTLITVLNPDAARATRSTPPAYYHVTEAAGSAKKSHTISTGSPYQKALEQELAKWQNPRAPRN